MVYKMLTLDSQTPSRSKLENLYRYFTLGRAIHWHVVSTIGTKHPEVNVFDSIYISIVIVLTIARYRYQVY